MGAGLSGDSTSTAHLDQLLGRLNQGDYDQALKEIGRRQEWVRWSQLPSQILLIRHGESEGNINRNIYTTKGDALLEVTPKGLNEAKQAGARLRDLVHVDDRVFVVVSTFERTQQTLLGLYLGGFPQHQVSSVCATSQIREQEFGNFQTVGLHEAARAEQAIVGRFYYRRANAESSADVYDRVAIFWEELLHETLPKQQEYNHTCLVVTHGLTLRLILMKAFMWSVETFETVWNIGNCHHITLRKDMEEMCYKVDPEKSFPQQIPWATRPVWIVFKSRKAEPATEERLKMLLKVQTTHDWHDLLPPGAPHAEESIHHDATGHWQVFDHAIDEVQNKRMAERSEAYTVLDYLTVPQPRTLQRETLDGRLVRGHGTFRRQEALQCARELPPLDWADVEFVDWWGSKLSYQGKMLRLHEACTHDLPGLDMKTSHSRRTSARMEEFKRDPSKEHKLFIPPHLPRHKNAEAPQAEQNDDGDDNTESEACLDMTAIHSDYTRGVHKDHPDRRLAPKEWFDGADPQGTKDDEASQESAAKPPKVPKERARESAKVPKGQGKGKGKRAAAPGKSA